MKEISENMNADWVKYFKAECETPIGFLQYYETEKIPKGEWSDKPIVTVGIDYLIGDKEYLGIKIYRAAKQDAGMITLLFRDTIQHVNSKDYPEDEMSMFRKHQTKCSKTSWTFHLTLKNKN